jgi:hypothetical protein
MLDYAANAKVSFNPDRMAAWLDDAARARGSTAAQELEDRLGVDDPETFWATVGTNLDAERFRLIFVADAIPRELRRIIEFLNGQMANTTVLAIEVKQYVDDDEQHQTIVPTVIGNTETAKQNKTVRRSRRQTNRSTLLAELAQENAAAATAAEALLEWGERHPRLNVRWNSAGDIGVVGSPGLLRLWGEGTLEVKVHSLRRMDPGNWDNDERIESLIQRLEQIPGVVLRAARLQWPRTPLAPLGDPSARAAFLAIIEEVLEELPASD